MTGKELYEQALELLGLEGEDVSYLEGHALGCINQLLCDRLGDNNALLRTAGGSAAESAPQLDDLDDEIPYQEMLVRECFPYGLAALLVAEDDRTMFNWMNSEYEKHAAYYAPCEECALLGTFE